ncbi:MAG: hypothetical protein C0631_14550 [Sedimenticola sp.]|nr:MAG: hypothetical protein C0631_14550 [Sedimenticola sp.]
MNTDLVQVKKSDMAKARIELDNDQLQPVDEQTQKLNDWEKERNRLRILLVLVVILFWGSIAFQAVLYYLVDGHLNITMLSIIGGMMILGVALKFRYQRHLRKKDR